MADKYGLIDAHYFFFECTLDGEDVGPFCTRGNDIDGWVDLLPIDDEGNIISVCPERHRGDVVFSDVRPTEGGSWMRSRFLVEIHDVENRLAQLRLDLNELQPTLLAAAADVQAVHDLNPRVAQLQMDYRGMRDTIHELVSDVEELADAHQSPEPRVDRGGPIVVGGDEVVAPQERFE